MAEPNLELLMQLMQKVLDSQREIREDVREIKTRLGRLETELAGLHVFMAERGPHGSIRRQAGAPRAPS